MKWYKLEEESPKNDGVYLCLFMYGGKLVPEVADFYSDIDDGLWRAGCWQLEFDIPVYWGEIPEFPKE